MTAREYRGLAREKIRGKWGLLALISFIYGVLLGVVSAISPWIGSVVAVAVGGARGVLPGSGFSNANRRRERRTGRKFRRRRGYGIEEEKRVSAGSGNIPAVFC